MAEVPVLASADPIRRVWDRFADVPMETLTKAWLVRQPGGAGQRSVETIVAHRRLHGTSGNCFDLAIWLLHELRAAGVRAHAVGRDFFTPRAHVAVVAYDGRGRRWLCDLGDQWILPFPLDATAGAREPLAGFFPGARVRVEVSRSECQVAYHRPSGRVSRQSYRLDEVADERLLAAADHSQRLLRKPACEVRVRLGSSIAHWEFSHGASFLSTDHGLVEEPAAASPAQWCARIHRRTGIAVAVVSAALEVYAGV